MMDFEAAFSPYRFRTRRLAYFTTTGRTLIRLAVLLVFALGLVPPSVLSLLLG